MCIIVANWKLKFQGKNSATIDLQKMEKNVATKELKQIWNSAVAIAVAVASVDVGILEQQHRRFCMRYLKDCDLEFFNLEDTCPRLLFTLMFIY